MSTQSESNLPLEVLENLRRLFPKGVIFFDLETTGLSPLFNEIVEFAGVKITPSTVETFSTLVKPSKPIPQLVINIHGISNEKVKNEPTELDIAPRIFDFISNYTLVAHNSKFDIGFLLMMFHRHQIRSNSNDVYCSCQLSRRINKEAKSHRLIEIAKQFDVELKSHHRALDDTLACLKIFSHLSKNIKQEKELKSSSYLFNTSDFQKVLEEDIPPHLLPLTDQSSQGKIVEIKYKGGTQKNKFRSIKPVSLLPLPSGNFLYAHCMKSDLLKYYKLDKITEMRILE